MTCPKAELLLTDYLDGLLQADDKVLLEQHLKNCVHCRKELETYRRLLADIQKDEPQKPGFALQEQFDKMLLNEINQRTKPPASSTPTGPPASSKNKIMFYKVAAGILLVITGFLAGMLVTRHRNIGSRSGGWQQDSENRNETITVTLLNNASASERIKAVNYIDEINKPNPKMLTALIKTMDEDKNVNVRLAALYALTKFSNNKKSVNDALVASLSKQTEPLMQIALINVLTERKEIKAKAPIREILQDNNAPPSVKEIAAKGLKIL